MGDQILVPKNRNVAFYRLIFSVTGCFFSLTLSKVYFKVRKDTLAILSVFRIGGQKGPLTSFSLVTSTNVGISHPNFLTFSFNPFITPA